MDSLRGRKPIHMPLIPIVIVYILGLMAGEQLAIPRTVLYPSITASILLSVLSNLRNWPKIRTVTILIVFWLFGILLIGLFLRPHFPPNHIFSYAGKGRVNVEGVLYRRPVPSPRRTKLYLRVERIYLPNGIIRARGNVLISVKEYRGNLRYGDRIRLITNSR